MRTWKGERPRGHSRTSRWGLSTGRSGGQPSRGAHRPASFLEMIPPCAIPITTLDNNHSAPPDFNPLTENSFTDNLGNRVTICQYLWSPAAVRKLVTATTTPPPWTSLLPPFQYHTGVASLPIRVTVQSAT